MISRSRVVFIIGFERCLTSSLATHLLQAGYCLPLVDGIKEPKLFSSDPRLATAILRRRTAQTDSWLIDASVNYVTNAPALAALRDTVEEYRLIVCLRNQFLRTVSAYQLYHGIFTRPVSSVEWNEWPFSVEFGDAGLRLAAANDPLALPRLRQPPPGKYVYSAIAAFAGDVESCNSETLRRQDLAVEEFAAESLPNRALSEIRTLRKTTKFPLMSILLNSYFAWWIEQLLAKFEERQLLFVTLQDSGVQERLDATLRSFLGTGARSTQSLPNVLASEQFGARVSAHDKQLAEQVLRSSLLEDTRKTIALLGAHRGLDLSLFSPEALYW